MKALARLLVPAAALAVCGMLFLARPALAAEEARLESAPIDARDIASLQAGARTFVNYCLTCHSASLMRYNRLRDLGLTDRQIIDNLMFSATKVGDMMTIAMTRQDAAAWFGPAPDLSVIARSRGADWLWTYLRGFYRDPGTATGWNNTVFPGVGMPNVLWQLQGQRVLKEEISRDVAGNPAKDSHGEIIKSSHFETVVPGTMSPLEFDTEVRDLVNFMNWMADPNQVLRKQVGVWVLFVIAVLVALTYALYKEFWKDVH